MRLRDRLYIDYDVVFILGPLPTAIVTALPDALHRVVQRDTYRIAGRAWPPRATTAGGGVARGGVGGRGSVQQVPPAVDDSGLVRAALAHGYHGVPIALTVSGDRVAVLLAHATADGVEAMALLRALLLEAAGAPAEGERRPAGLVLLRAARAAGLPAFRAWAAARREPRPAPVSTPAPTEAQAARAGLDLRRFIVDGEDLRRLRTGRSGRGRATLSTRVISVALAALRDCATEERDQRVAVPVDLRHLVGDRRVAGNLVSVEALGNLRSDDWSPAAIGAKIAAQRTVALPALLASVVRDRVLEPLAALRRSSSPVWREYAVSVSVLPALDLPAGLWPHPQPLIGCATVGPWPSAAFVFALTAKDSVSVSVFDESDSFDLDRYEAAFRAEIARRVG